MIKELKDLKKGDIIKTEYGDYNNTVMVTVESVKPCADAKYVEIIGHYTKSKKHIEMFGLMNDTAEVVESAERK